MVSKIVSGGQTGVDRGALEAALAAALPVGGWVPLGGLAEDGTVPGRYGLVETPAEHYEERTIWNVADSDATLVLNRGPLSGGTLYTVDAARCLQRPCLVVDLERLDPDEVLGWLSEAGVEVLNVAGPRESKSPGIEVEARRVVALLLERATGPTSPSPSA